MKKYLIPIKNGFLVYQPKSDTVYRGRRKTAGLNFALTVPFWMAIITPILEFVADYLWPFLDYSGYRIIKYTLLMTIFGIIYYKYVYTKNKIKLLQSQLESVKISDIKEEIFKDTIETFIVSIIGGMFFFCVSFFAVINMYSKYNYKFLYRYYSNLLSALCMEEPLSVLFVGIFDEVL